MVELYSVNACLKHNRFTKKRKTPSKRWQGSNSLNSEEFIRLFKRLHTCGEVFSKHLSVY